MILALQALLALAYSLLAHLAGHRHDDRIAAAALAVLAVLVLLRPLSRPRRWAWIALALAGLGIAWLQRAGLAALPMLLVPVAFIGLVASWFGRSLRAGQVPLISRIVAALDGTTLETMPAALRDYTRALTAAWAWLLGTLAAINLLLAAIAVPGGLLARLGWQAPVTVTQAQWSLFANILNYGIIAGFFILEFHARKRRFPGRYRSFAGFLRSLAGLGPAFWKDFLR